MYRFFVTSGAIEGETLTVAGPDAHHMAHVLRMTPGEDFEAVDEAGRVYTCRIEELRRSCGEASDRRPGDDRARSGSGRGAPPETIVRAKILFSELSGCELKSRLVLYQGLPKFEKMELIIQKAVELGASEIIPVSTARTVVRLDAKKAASKRERWQAIAVAAAKQSKRSVIPDVAPVMTFREALENAAALDHILIPYEKAEDIAETKALLSALKSGESVGVFIGPEGGFEEREIEEALTAGAKAVTLGPRILRCETAATTTLSILMFQLTE